MPSDAHTAASPSASSGPQDTANAGSAAQTSNRVAMEQRAIGEAMKAMHKTHRRQRRERVSLGILCLLTLILAVLMEWGG